MLDGDESLIVRMLVGTNALITKRKLSYLAVVIIPQLNVLLYTRVGGSLD